MKLVLIGLAMASCTVFLLLPLINVFGQAFAKGLDYYRDSLTHADSWAAIR